MAFLLCGVFFATPGWGDDRSNADLSGVTAVRLTVSQTTPDASSCGVDLRNLLPVLSEALQVGGLGIDPASAVTVTLSVMTGYHNATGVCSTTPMIGVYRRVSYFDEAAGWLRSGHAVLWQRSNTALSNSADHPGVAKGAVTGLADALLSSWRANNTGSNKL